MQTNSTSPIKTWLENLKQAVIDKWNEATNKAKESLTGCVTAPFRFLWNVVRVLWDFTWRLFWIITGTGCLVSTPVAVLIAALIMGTGWFSIPLALISIVVGIPIAFVLWLVVQGIKALVKAFFSLFVSKDARVRKEADNREKAKTVKILISCLLITGICGPMVVFTAPILLYYGIKAAINAYREYKAQ